MCIRDRNTTSCTFNVLNTGEDPESYIGEELNSEEGNFIFVKQIYLVPRNRVTFLNSIFGFYKLNWTKNNINFLEKDFPVSASLFSPS